jgi:hypothetical protein
MHSSPLFTRYAHNVYAKTVLLRKQDFSLCRAVDDFKLNPSPPMRSVWKCSPKEHRLVVGGIEREGWSGGTAFKKRSICSLFKEAVICCFRLPSGSNF